MSFQKKGVLVVVCLAALSIAIPQGRVFAQADTGSYQVQEYEWKVTVSGYFRSGVSKTYDRIYAATGSQAEEIAIARFMAQYHYATNVRVTDIIRK